MSDADKIPSLSADARMRRNELRGIIADVMVKLGDPNGAALLYTEALNGVTAAYRAAARSPSIRDTDIYVGLLRKLAATLSAGTIEPAVP